MEKTNKKDMFVKEQVVKLSRELTQKRKEEIDQAVQKFIDEYGETLRLLGSSSDEE